MPVLIIPNVFLNGTVADADLVNQDFNATAGVVNALDHQNIGPAGIFAEQIKPRTPEEATFGGAHGYRFEAKQANQRALTIAGAFGQTARVLAVVDGANNERVVIDHNYDVHIGSKLYVVDELLVTRKVELMHTLEVRGLATFYNAAHVHGRLDVTVEVQTPYLGVGVDGIIRFGAAHSIFRHEGAVAIVAGAHKSGNAWIADNHEVGMLHVSHQTDGIAFYYNQNLVLNGPFTPAKRLHINQLGVVFPNTHSGERISFPYGNSAIGFWSNGMYVGWNFHYDHVRSNFIADGTTAGGFLLGAQPGYNVRVQMFYNEGLTVGQPFTPEWALALANTAPTRILCRNGIQPRSNDMNGTVGTNIFGGGGVPNAALGLSGDYFFRNDGMQRIYYKTNNTTWTPIIGNPLGADEEEGVVLPS